MTQYAGEQTKIVHTATVDARELFPDDVTAVWITVYTSDFSDEVVGETEMTWDTEFERWQYLWDTSAVSNGTYKAKVRVEGVDGASNWEYRRIRLARDPAAV